MSRAATGGIYRRRAVKPKIQIVHTVDEERTVRGTALRVIRDATIVEAPAQPDLPAMRFPHVTLPSSIVRELGPCMLQRDDLRFLREVVLPKLRRGSIVLPAQPRYRLGGSMAATGGWMFVVRARHRIGAVVARIGIGWRDHGASLVWRECVGDPNASPAGGCCRVRQRPAPERLRRVFVTGHRSLRIAWGTGPQPTPPTRAG